MIRLGLHRAAGALLLIGLLMGTPAGAGKKQESGDYQRVSQNGRIDWGKGVLTATGLGAVSTKEANSAKAYLRARSFAKLDALRNLLMVIDHVRIDSQTVGSDFEANDEIRAEVQGIVKGAQIVNEREIRIKGNTMIEVTVATNMYGDEGVAQIFLPHATRHADAPDTAPELPVPPALRSRVGTGVAPVLPPPALEEDRTVAPDSGQPYTSVIIDTRGFKIERSMAPKIKRQDGSEVWGTVRVDDNFVIEQGIVVYARSLSEAKKIDRAGANPLILKAVARGGNRFPSDAVLSDADAEMLMAVNRRDGFLNRFNVIFIVDPARPLP